MVVRTKSTKFSETSSPCELIWAFGFVVGPRLAVVVDVAVVSGDTDSGYPKDSTLRFDRVFACQRIDERNLSARTLFDKVALASISVAATNDQKLERILLRCRRTDVGDAVDSTVIHRCCRHRRHFGFVGLEVLEAREEQIAIPSLADLRTAARSTSNPQKERKTKSSLSRKCLTLMRNAAEGATFEYFDCSRNRRWAIEETNLKLGTEKLSNFDEGDDDTDPADVREVVVVGLGIVFVVDDDDESLVRLTVDCETKFPSERGKKSHGNNHQNELLG